ncbi:MAG: low molecular weight protein-tyrosine-phosphatase [Bacteroidota bacterium]
MKVLMVCLGNICRSPLAEGLFRQKAEDNNMEIDVDSCGTSGYHNGEAPDPRTTDNARKNGLDLSMLRSRKFHASDFDTFDLIYVMDSSNYANVKALSRSDSDMEKVDFLLNATFPGENRAVPDPYFGGENGFQEVYDLVNDACEQLIQKLSS